MVGRPTISGRLPSLLEPPSSLHGLGAMCSRCCRRPTAQLSRCGAAPPPELTRPLLRRPCRTSCAASGARSL